MIAAAQTWGWLFRRLVLWGVATGAGAGATVGTLFSIDAHFPVGAGLLTGAVLGAIVALVPSLLGGTLVTDAVRTRDDEARVLAICFALAAAVLNAGCLVAIVTYGDAYGLLTLLVGDAGGLPMLWWGHRRVTRAMN